MFAPLCALSCACIDHRHPGEKIAWQAQVMKRYFWYGFGLILLVSMAALLNCKGPDASQPARGEPTVLPGSLESHRRLVILYTSDEHGWMEAIDSHGGAAGLMGLWLYATDL